MYILLDVWIGQLSNTTFSEVVAYGVLNEYLDEYHSICTLSRVSLLGPLRPALLLIALPLLGFPVQHS